MPEYIDRESLKKVLTRYLNAPHVQIGDSLGQGMRMAIKSCIELLDNEYTADVAPVRHGRWVASGQCNHKPYRMRSDDHWTTYKCSECGFSNGRRYNDNFCPNCGAKMDGGDTNA